MRPSLELVLRGTLFIWLVSGYVAPGLCSDRSALVTSQAIKVLADDPAQYVYFGYAADIDGNHMVVGAYYASTGGWTQSGAAYIFRRNHLSSDGWEQVARLAQLEPYMYDNFGVAVAISGDTVVVGTMESYGGGTAYVYERNQGGIDAWGLASILVGSDTVEDDYFGRAVDIDGDTLVIGAYGDDDGGSTAGAAYVFRREPGTPGGDWDEISKLTASDAAAAEYFGLSVGISGDTAVVGCFRDSVIAADAGAAYIYERNHGGIEDSWGEVVKLVASDPDQLDRFGRSVAIDGSTVVAGAYHDDDSGIDAGAAYLFERNNGGADSWGQVRKLTASDATELDNFGSSVALDDSTVVVGAPMRDMDGTFQVGAVYVFERNHGGANLWGQVTMIVPPVTDSDQLGSSVAIDGTFIAAGASRDDENGSGAGAAWVYLRDGDRWPQEASPRPLDGEDGDKFGIAVGISNDTAIAGAYYDDDGATDAGSAYILERNQDGRNTWQHVAKVVALDPSEDARFGYGVDISGGTAVVGAVGDDEAGSSAGAAYIFARNHPIADSWGELKKLLPVSPPTGAWFGFAVAIDRDTALVGAHSDDGATGRSGSVYVFERNQDGPEAWGPVTQLAPSDPAFQDYFGCSVDIDGDLAVVGAWGNDDLGNLTGAAYIFSRHQGGGNAWGQVAKLVGHEAGEQFGRSIAVDGSLVVAGAPLNDGLAENAGAAYVYERNQGGAADGWGLVATLTAEADAGASAAFGEVVDIEGNRIVVGSPSDYTNGTAYAGTAYLFEQNRGGADAWGRIAKVFPTYGARYYGEALAMTATELIGGGPDASHSFTAHGRAYVHRLTALESDLSVTKSDGSDTVTTPGTTVVYDLTVANAGPDAVVGAVLTDVLDPALFDTASAVWTCAPDTGAGPETDCPASGDAADLAAGVAVDVESGDSVTFVLTAPVPYSATGDLVNTATIDAPSNVYDPDLDNNRSTDINTLRELDFGDAPDPSYPTLLASGGGRARNRPVAQAGRQRRW